MNFECMRGNENKSKVAKSIKRRMDMTHLEFAFGLLPVSLIIASFIVTLIIQKVYFMPVVSFIILLILTFTLFNVSFIGWAVVYTLGSFIASYIALFIMKILNKKRS